MRCVRTLVPYDGENEVAYGGRGTDVILRLNFGMQKKKVPIFHILWFRATNFQIP